MEPTALDIATSFNTQNDKKHWKARATTRNKADAPTEQVLFESAINMVALIYYPDRKVFAVKFNKFQAAWGDYIKGIARSLHVVLNTLKSAGLPFEAPPSIVGMSIACGVDEGEEITVAWINPSRVYVFKPLPGQPGHPEYDRFVENTSLPAMRATMDWPIDDNGDIM